MTIDCADDPWMMMNLSTDAKRGASTVPMETMKSETAPESGLLRSFDADPSGEERISTLWQSLLHL
jgi:hypothetical protein